MSSTGIMGKSGPLGRAGQTLRLAAQFFLLIALSQLAELAVAASARMSNAWHAPQVRRAAACI